MFREWRTALWLTLLTDRPTLPLTTVKEMVLPKLVERLTGGAREDERGTIQIDTHRPGVLPLTTKAFMA